MKKAFTFMELIVSISLLSLVIIFLYKSFGMTHQSNSFFENKVEEKLMMSQLKRIILKDMVEGKVLEIRSSGPNSALLLQSNNSYHNSFYNYVSYFISNEGNLVRIESYKPFDSNKLDDAFFKQAYVDIVQEGMTGFVISSIKGNDTAYTIKLEKNSGEKALFTSLQFGVL